MIGFTCGSDGKESACNAWGLSFIPGLGRSSKEGNGYPLQHSCLENSMDRGAWRATVYGVAKSQTRLSDFHFHFTSLHDGKEHQEENIHHCGVLGQRGLWIPERCELWVWSLQAVERSDFSPVLLSPFCPPLPRPLIEGCCCPFSWLPSSLPSTVNQSQIQGK